MIETARTLEKIKFWHSIVKAITFNLAMLFVIFYLTGLISIDHLIYAFLTITIVISMLWWGWTIYAISLLSELVRRSRKNINDVIADVQTVKKTISELKPYSYNKKQKSKKS